MTWTHHPYCPKEWEVTLDNFRYENPEILSMEDVLLPGAEVSLYAESIGICPKKLKEFPIGPSFKAPSRSHSPWVSTEIRVLQIGSSTQSSGIYALESLISCRTRCRTAEKLVSVDVPNSTKISAPYGSFI
jgi:hypothetical protein